jgi:membrane protease YdiL (CAAX protease family)
MTLQHKAGWSETWLYILVCFAIATLVCAAKNYLSVSLLGTPVCGLLCPSVFGNRALDLPASLDWLFGLQVGTEAHLQNIFDAWLHDRYLLMTGLVVAPVLEEGIYRGPLYLLRKWSDHPLWWLGALLTTVLFALSHSVALLALIPLATLGFVSAWLIARTGKFWRSLTLHFFYNFFLLSVTLYQSLYWMD